MEIEDSKKELYTLSLNYNIVIFCHRDWKFIISYFDDRCLTELDIRKIESICLNIFYRGKVK